MDPKLWTIKAEALNSGYQRLTFGAPNNFFGILVNTIVRPDYACILIMRTSTMIGLCSAKRFVISSSGFVSHPLFRFFTAGRRR